jgi:glutaredoxin-dependent peroxiredoxin
VSNKSTPPSIEIGQDAPDFELPDTDMNTHKLSDYRGKRLILAFFPAAESPVCTLEMCKFRDSLAVLKESGAEIIGISVDGPFANKIFSKNRQLNFPLLSDYKKETIHNYGIVMKDLGKLKDYNAAKRSIFIVDSDGTTRYKWVSDNPLVEPNYDEIKLQLQKQE